MCWACCYGVGRVCWRCWWQYWWGWWCGITCANGWAGRPGILPVRWSSWWKWRCWWPWSWQSERGVGRPARRLSVAVHRLADNRFAVYARVLENDLVVLAVGFDLAQADQQVVPVLGEPQGGFPLGARLAGPLNLHRIELAVAGGHP